MLRMDKASFQHLLDHPDQLLTVPLSELQGLSLEYPYSANIRLLLLLRARLEEVPDQADHLSRAAAATFDRGHLYDLLRDLDRRATEPAAETLELIGLEELREERLAEGPVEEALPSRMNELAADAPPPAVFSDPDPVTPAPPRVSEKPAPAPAPEFNVPTAWASRAAAFLSVFPPDFTTATNPAPERIDKFPGYRPAGQPLSNRLRELRRKTIPVTVPAADRTVDRIAHQSVTDRADVASETLARLLVRQGQYRNAIKMYRRLVLLNPEKKAIFAALIKELKEKL